MRNFWKNYYDDSDGLIYVIDSSDPSRLDESAHQLSSLLEDDLLSGVPLLILANKNDKEGALSETQISEQLYLEDIQGRPNTILSSSAITSSNLDSGMEWIMNEISIKRGD